MSDKMSAEEFQENLKNGNIFSDGKGKLHFKDKPVSTIKKTAKKIKEDKIDLFCKLLKQELNIDCVKEYQFCPERKWRADYYVPSINTIIECEGGVFARQRGEKSRHFNGQGILNDMSKYNKMTEMGFKLIRVQPSELLTKGYQAVLNIINNNKNEKMDKK